MNIAQLQEMIKKDIALDSKNLSKTIIQIPSFYAKYLVLLQREQLNCTRIQSEYDSKYKERYMFYRNDFNVILKNKAEIDVLINGDEEMSEIKDRLFLSKNICETIESAMKQISGMSFLIKDYIEWEKFQQGA